MTAWKRARPILTTARRRRASRKSCAAGQPPRLKADPTLRFVAMGDTGKGNQGQKDVAAAIAAHCAARGCDFVQLLGDNIYDSGVKSVDDPQWQTKFEIPIHGDQPAVLRRARQSRLRWGRRGLGVWQGRLRDRLHREVDEVEATGESLPPHGGQRRLLRSRHQPDDVQPRCRQAEGRAGGLAGFVDDDVEDRVWSPPVLSNGSHGNAGNYDGLWYVPIAGGQGVKKFFDDNVCGKVDLYISGHDHSRQWLTDTCRGTELAVSGAGASATDLPGRNKTRFQSKELGFLYVSIVGRTLTAEFIDQTGKSSSRAR